MNSSSPPVARGAEHYVSSEQENHEKTTHSKGEKWYASNYRTKFPSDIEMMATIERNSNQGTQEVTNDEGQSGMKNRRAVSPTTSNQSNHTNPPVHFGRVAVELSTIKDITTGIRDEVNAYSNLERRYVRELEKKLPKCAGMGDIRMHMTVDQLERIRRYRRNALAELTDMTVKIASLESRVERIAFEAAEAELNAKLAELEALYCVPEVDVLPPSIDTTPIADSGTTAPLNATLTTVSTPQSSSPRNNPRTNDNPSIPPFAPTKEKKSASLVVPKPEMPKTPRKAVKNTVQEHDSEREIVNETAQETKEKQSENVHADIPNDASAPLATTMSNKQIASLRQLLSEYKSKKNEALSTGRSDVVLGNGNDADDNAPASVDSGDNLVQQQLANDPDSSDESIDDMLAQARKKRPRMSAESIKMRTHISGKNKRLLVAVGAGSSIAAGVLMLETRTGMISKAFSGMLRMLG